MMTENYFNSQPHKEADGYVRAFSTISVYFNSQPHKEADTSRRQEVIDYVIISTHSLTRRLTASGKKTAFQQ